MRAPAHSLRVVFALSALACSVIVVLFLHGRVTWTPEFWTQLGLASVAGAALVCWLAFRRGGLRLVEVPVGLLLRVFVLRLWLSYLASAALLTAVALAVIYAVTRSGANSLALAVLAGLWLALWVAPGVASFISWRRLSALPAGPDVTGASEVRR